MTDGYPLSARLVVYTCDSSNSLGGRLTMPRLATKLKLVGLPPWGPGGHEKGKAPMNRRGYAIMRKTILMNAAEIPVSGRVVVLLLALATWSAAVAASPDRPLDLVQSGRLMSWAEPNATEATEVTSLGDLAPGVRCVGVTWNEERDVREIRVRLAGSAEAVDATVQYWFQTWPARPSENADHRRPARRPVARKLGHGSGRIAPPRTALASSRSSRSTRPRTPGPTICPA